MFCGFEYGIITISVGIPTEPKVESNFNLMQSKKSAEAVVPAAEQVSKSSGYMPVLRNFEKLQGRAELIKLDPNYLVGFVDGEGSFCVSMNKHKTTKFKVDIRPEFEIELREDDAEIIHRIQATLNCGNIYRLEYERYDWLPHVKFRVGKISELQEIVVPFFEKYPLQAKKREDFNIFKVIVDMVYRKEHLTYSGIKRILKLREKMRQHSKKHYKNR